MIEGIATTISWPGWLWTTLFIPIIHIVGVLHAIDATMHQRSAQGAVAWAITLTLFPYFALPAYWAFGPRKFKSYKGKISNSRNAFTDLTRSTLDAIRSSQNEIPEEYVFDLQFLEKIADWPLTHGNTLTIHPDGEEFFEKFFQKISEAKDYILIHFYIIYEDETGKELKKRLIEKAAEGVRVYLMYDQVGSMNLSHSYLEELREAGVEINEFCTNRGLTNRFRLNFRNHRKLMVVDGAWASIGGHNLGDNYRTGDSQCGFLQDLSIIIQGPAVIPIQRTLAQDWYWGADSLPDFKWESQIHDEDISLLPLATGPIDEIDNCSLYLMNLIRIAKKRLWLTTPYFTPDDVIMSTLQLAALRGIDVQLIIPETTDLRIAHLATRASARELAQSGARIFEYSLGFIHQKLIIVDDDFASVGSANLDNRSLHLNFEESVFIANERKVLELQKIFKGEKKKSHEISEHLLQTPYLKMIPQQVARLFSPVL